jgi:serine/threonine protein kinase/Tol biopolymer transport system component/tetratricopeptide (TPR) repeat protein
MALKTETALGTAPFRNRLTTEARPLMRVDHRRWEQVKLIVADAIALDRTQRPAFIAAACRDDDDLRREVESLLESHDDGGDLFESSPFSSLTADNVLTEDVGSYIGTRIGAYELVRELGRGGMGTVFLAVRADREFEKRVAIKLIRRGMENDFVVRRFRNERQILAGLEHPNIARLIDGGTTENGSPYFIMEYVEGKPLDEYVAEHHLDTSECIELVLRACAAVEYAHRRRIVHRDLKPTNILVEHDGTPKLLDFGIAKLTGGETTARRLETTLANARLMTPAYASPEQLRGEPGTVRSDIYSLGVILSELVRRRPSIAGTSKENSLAISRDLDAVIRRATQGDPADRYGSVQEFSERLRECLSPSAAAEIIPGPHAPVPAIQDSLSLAVLPFHTFRTTDSTDEYLGVGLADALITKLSNVRSISVKPTSSVLRYVASADPVAAGRELGVMYVLEGHIRRHERGVRVTAQLLNTRTGKPVWATQIDEDANEILKLEEALSGQLALALVPRLTTEERERVSRQGTSNPEAHKAYLKGRWHWSSYTTEGLARALLCFTEAVVRDPNYAEAHAGIADFHIWTGIWGGLNPAESFATAKDSARRALELNPSLGEAHASFAFALWAADRNLAASEREFQMAIMLKPDYPTAHQWFALFEAAAGRHDLAEASMQRARASNPSSPIVTVTHALCLYQRRDFERALSILAESPTGSANGLIPQMRAWCLLELGRVDEAVDCARSATRITAESVASQAVLACALARAGAIDSAREMLQTLYERSADRYVSRYLTGCIQVALGNKDLALRDFDAAIAAGDWWTVWLPLSPWLTPLRNDARFQALAVRTTGAAPAVVRRPGSRRSLMWAGIAAAILAIGVLGYLYVRQRLNSPPFQTTQITKLTTNGITDGAAISPDGRYVAYSTYESGKMALWLRQVASAARARIAGPFDANIGNIIFSPDDAYVHFTLHRKNEPARISVYRVPTLGGPEQREMETVASAISMSADCTRLAILRLDQPDGSDQLVSARLDGSGEQSIAVRHHPERFAWGSTPAWSPDARRVAIAVDATDRNGFAIKLQVINLDDVSRTEIPEPRWQSLSRIEWLRNQRGLVVIGQEHDSSFQQIWYVPYPRGTPKRITNDLNDYATVSTTADSRELVTVQAETLTNVYVLQNASSDVPKQITPGGGRYFDLSWAPDGHLVYASDASGSADLWTMDADGSGQRQLTDGAGRNYSPAVSPDGKSIVFHSNRTGNWNIWRMDPDGANARPLTADTHDSNWPQFTSDGRWVVYHHTGADALWDLWKVPVGGGTPVQLTSKLTTHPAISPRDGRIACWYSDNAANPKWAIAVLPPDGGTPEKMFVMPSTVIPDTTLRWTPDGAAITYLDFRGGAANLWVQPVNGSPAHAVTHFTGGILYSFEWSREGKLAYSHGTRTTDAVLMRDIRE